MKKSIVFILLLGLFAGCEKTADNDMIIDDNLNVTNSTDLLKSAGICEVSFIAAQSIPVGTVSSEFNDAGDQLTVTYAITNTDWCILETHLDVQVDPASFPLTNSGNPQLGQFAYGEALVSCGSSWSQTIDLNTVTDWEAGMTLYIAAHADVQNLSGEEEGAWGEGELTPGNNWAMYFDCIPPCFVCGDPIIDERDGQYYNTVQIGDQCWMAENLNIGTRVNGLLHQEDNDIIEKYCYNDLESNCDVYGGLYQWAEMVQYLNGVTNTTWWNPVPTDDVIGICPDGWHLPTQAEWAVLSVNLGLYAGNEMKETGTTHWSSTNTGVTNESGFTALPGGHRLYYNGTFFSIGTQGVWWMRTETYQINARIHRLFDDLPYLNSIFSRKTSGYSVRCVKDDN